MDPLEVLPEEVWLHHVLPLLFGLPYPEGPKVVMTSAAVCRRWRRVGLDPAQWRARVRPLCGPDIMEPLPPTGSHLLWASPFSHAAPPDEAPSQNESAGWVEFYWAVHRTMATYEYRLAVQDCRVRFGLLGKIVADIAESNTWSPQEAFSAYFFSAAAWRREDVFRYLVDLCRGHGGEAFVKSTFIAPRRHLLPGARLHYLMREAILVGSKEILSILLSYHTSLDDTFFIWCAEGPARGKEDLVEMVICASESNRQQIQTQFCKPVGFASNPSRDQDALTIACLHNEFKLAQLFLKYGADVNRVGRLGTGDTPLSHLARHGPLEAARWLVEQGARAPPGSLLQACGEPGWSVQMVELWLSAGADVNEADGSGGGVLHKAAGVSNHMARLIGLLVRHGAEINARNSAQRTPLHIAARQGHRHTIRALLAAGAQVWVWDNDLRTPIDVLAPHVDPVTRQLLLENGCGTPPPMMTTKYS